MPEEGYIGNWVSKKDQLLMAFRSRPDPLPLYHLAGGVNSSR